MVPSRAVVLEDIRWQWVTHENINLWMDDMKNVFVKYGFATNEEEVFADGRVSEIKYVEQLLARNLHFDKTNHSLGTERDRSGPRAISYVHPLLNRGGARSTRGNRHLTGGYSVSMAAEVLPPLYIYDTNATRPENFAINDEWTKDFPWIRGKWGHKNYIERKPYVAVRFSGSMDVSLFCDMISHITFDLYPEETVSLNIKFDETTGELITAPVIWNTDTGLGSQ